MFIKITSAHILYLQFLVRGRDESFTVEGFEALFDFLELLDPEGVLNIEEIDNRFNQYDSLEEFNEETGRNVTQKDLEYKYSVAWVSGGGFIIELA